MMHESGDLPCKRILPMPKEDWAENGTPTDYTAARSQGRDPGGIRPLGSCTLFRLGAKRVFSFARTFGPVRKANRKE